MSKIRVMTVQKYSRLKINGTECKMSDQKN